MLTIFVNVGELLSSMCFPEFFRKYIRYQWFQAFVAVCGTEKGNVGLLDICLVRAQAAAPARKAGKRGRSRSSSSMISARTPRALFGDNAKSTTAESIIGR